MDGEEGIHKPRGLVMMFLNMPGRCTARALDCWREHAVTQRRMFGVAGNVAGRMLHRYCRFSGEFGIGRKEDRKCF